MEQWFRRRSFLIYRTIPCFDTFQIHRVVHTSSCHVTIPKKDCESFPSSHVVICWQWMSTACTRRYGDYDNERDENLDLEPWKCWNSIRWDWKVLRSSATFRQLRRNFRNRELNFVKPLCSFRAAPCDCSACMLSAKLQHEMNCWPAIAIIGFWWILL